jgi:hypothetical protein
MVSFVNYALFLCQDQAALSSNGQLIQGVVFHGIATITNLILQNSLVGEGSV